MDCRTARHLLEFTRPGGADLDRADQADLERHLADCPDCDGLARAERRADDHLGRAVRDVPVPHGLRERLLRRLAEEREAWYRRWLARGLRTAAAAAAVVLIAWFALTSWRKHHLPRYDEATLASAVLEQHSVAPPNRDDAEAFFRDKGFLTAAPAEFDYRYLFGYHIQDDFRIGGDSRRHRVPCLEFVRIDEGRQTAQLARVYVLLGDRFNLRGLPEEYKSPSGDRYRVQVWHRGKYAYVVVYTGSDLEDMLVAKKDRPGA
jgi:predicted anti-sigma-YlaC factor YlaD